ncbi:hypothetical protein [Kordia sp.]|uniref:hypothetical protein n=1 Tax=Kordia sp. TaxID=1965332 RepID=UPI003B597530
MMKKIVYIVCFLACFSCADRAPSTENALESEESNVTSDGWTQQNKGQDADFKSSDFAVETINLEITEKLQANYEAQVLAVKHPEFQEAIKEQLKGSTKFNAALSDSVTTIEVRNLSFYGKQHILNDSISTQKMRYTSLINSKYSQKDSVLVVIKRTMIMIDNSPKVNTSFVFEKLDN